MVAYLGGVEQMKKLQPLICLSVRLGFTQTYMSWLLFLDSEDTTGLSLGAIWNLSKGTGLPSPNIRLWGTKGLF